MRCTDVSLYQPGTMAARLSRLKLESLPWAVPNESRYTGSFSTMPENALA